MASVMIDGLKLVHEWQLWDVGTYEEEGDRLVARFTDERDALRVYEFWNQGAPAGCVWLEEHVVIRKS